MLNVLKAADGFSLERPRATRGAARAVDGRLCPGDAEIGWPDLRVVLGILTRGVHFIGVDHDRPGDRCLAAGWSRIEVDRYRIHAGPMRIDGDLALRLVRASIHDG